MAMTLHIVGCGRVGRTLARLWTRAGVLRIGWIFNRSVASARDAVKFIGDGEPVERPGTIGDTDWLMVAAPDGALGSLAADLARRLAGSPALAFHVSGSEPAEVLRPLGCPVASVHPVRPFADPAFAFERFAGTLALGEGDDAALDRLLPAFDAAGANTARFRPIDKRRYHAATIAASNFLNVLDDLALTLAESAGLDTAGALELVVSVQRAALDNIERSGPMESLTGPIERGDRRMCERLSSLLRETDGGDTLLALARATADLAARKHGARTGGPPGAAGGRERGDPAPGSLRDLFSSTGPDAGGRSDAGV